MELREAQTLFSEKMKSLQEAILQKMASIDSGLVIQKDPWSRKDFAGNDGGGGLTCSAKGAVFEKAGVNTSEIWGEVDPQFAKSLQGSGNQLWASGLSLILHPINPKVPTVHANFRMICQGETFWFGGGADLTPYYPYQEDFRYFHNSWKHVLKPFGHYEKMKQECDRYFTNPHRDGEMRGVGGFFFDHYKTGDLQADYQMVTELAENFCSSYFPIAEKRLGESFTPEDEEFMLHRRGRYVEFNLIHDRGTLFGLRTNGRTESILISLPPRVKFSYQYAPTEAHHKEMLKFYRSHDWA